MEDPPQYNVKICTNSDCKYEGREQPITNFEVRNITRTNKYLGRRNQCKTCNAKRKLSLESYVTNMLNNCKKRAKIVNMDYDINLNFLLQLYDNQDHKCSISRMPLTYIVGNLRNTSKNPFNLSVDRIDSNIGYLKTNVQLVCVWIQIAKNEWDQTNFINWIKSTAKYINTGESEICDITTYDKIENMIAEKNTYVPIKKESLVKKCIHCDVVISKQSTMCVECFKNKNKKFNIEEEELYDLVHKQKIPLTSIGKKYGVSDNAIRKRCISLNISVPSKKQKK